VSSQRTDVSAVFRHPEALSNDEIHLLLKPDDRPDDPLVRKWPASERGGAGPRPQKDDHGERGGRQAARYREGLLEHRKGAGRSLDRKGN